MLERSDPATDALTRAVAGQYRLERIIGRGGMGIVYLATDEQLERPVAIKTLPQHLGADARVRGRFLREARTAAALSHPNIVPIYSAAEREGVVYFAMRYIAGESLAERIAREGTLPPDEVISVLRQLASALHYAHANGVVHRDIKAENVLLDSETGRAMLTDFGIARLAETQPLTATGTVLGTVQYMSPEQVSGDALDGRSDLYSLGILGFMALCGRFPFERPTASAIVVAHVTAMPPGLCTLAPSVPAELGAIIDRLLAKSANDRFADGRALRQALDALPTQGDVSLVRAHDSAPVRPLVARVATPVAAINKLSSLEAQEVWARAAELQANTGVIVPPAEFSLRKFGVSNETVGFDTALVRASAVDAGIDERYVDRALAERALAERERDFPASQTFLPDLREGESMRKRVNKFIGSPTRLEFETSFDGELSDFGFEEVAHEIRRSLGEMVTVSAIGRTLTVTTSPSSRGGPSFRQLQIHLTSRHGRTNVQVFEDFSQLSGAMFGGIMGGVGGGGGSIAMGILMNLTRNPAVAITAWASVAGLAYLGARLGFARLTRKREVELRQVVQRIVTRAQAVAAQEAPNRLLK